MIKFDWEGVRRAINFYEKLSFKCHSICKPGTVHHNPIPRDLRGKILITPNVFTVGKDADDLFTLKLALHRNCQFVDNDQYQDWKSGYRPGLEKYSLQKIEELHVCYMFDATGTFVPLKDPILTPLLSDE